MRISFYTGTTLYFVECVLVINTVNIKYTLIDFSDYKSTVYFQFEVFRFLYLALLCLHKTNLETS